jgi:hypothetical protein
MRPGDLREKRAGNHLEAGIFIEEPSQLKYHTIPEFPAATRNDHLPVIQTVRDHTCLPQAGTSDIILKLKIKGKGPIKK